MVGRRPEECEFHGNSNLVPIEFCRSHHCRSLEKTLAAVDVFNFFLDDFEGMTFVFTESLKKHTSNLWASNSFFLDWIGELSTKLQNHQPCGCVV